MFNQANLSTVIQVVTLLGVAWTIYASLKKPQETSQINDAVFDERIKNIEKHVTNHILHKLDQNDDEHKKLMEGMVRIETKLEILMKQ